MFNLRLVKIEARLSDKNSNGTEGQDWASRVMSLAYDSFSVSPFRRLKILINPIGGQGKSVSLFEQKVRPILEASGCKLSIEVTKYRYHGHEIAKNLDLEKFDCLICVSGDGMLHEVLNGFASRSDAREAFKRITVVPIPAGLMADLDLGTEDLRALGDARFIIGFLGGVIKHSTCEVDIDVKLGQKGSLNRREMRKRRLNWDWSSLGEDQDESKEEEEEVQEQVSGEEIKTSLGEEVNHGEEESKAWRTDALGNKIPTKIKNLNMPDLTHGAVTDDLGELESFEPKDPSGQRQQPLPIEIRNLLLLLQANGNVSTYQFLPFTPENYPTLQRDLLQFPYSIPGDETIDLALQLLKGGRIGKLKAIGGAESGQVVFDQGLSYLKVEAFRVTPRLKEGDKKLKKGGLISIDGEKVDWNKFQVEVVKDVKFGVMSLYGVLCTPDVKPEGLSGDDQWEEIIEMKDMRERKRVG
ncbi:hypothetical protein L7F22_007090 [Adiantum nelumboides]|nr:hypothetical protein [Adiantum nelumboides]